MQAGAACYADRSMETAGIIGRTRAPRWSPTTIVAIAAFALFTIWIGWRAKTLERSFAPDREIEAMTNRPAPGFALPSIDNRTVSLSDFHGKKKLVVSFWASWCGPCRLELPMLRSFYQRNHKPESDFEFLAISIDEDRAAAEAAARDGKLPFPVLLDTEGKVARAFHVQSIPALFVIDVNGKVVHGDVGVSPAVSLLLAQYLGIVDKPPTIGAPGAGRDH